MSLDGSAMKRALLLGALAVAVAAAGCMNVYESGSPRPVECDVTYNQSELDDGRTNPLLCERVEDGNASTGEAGNTSGSPDASRG